MRKCWTDERLDDLNQRVETGFARVDEDIRALRAEMSSRFDSMQGQLDSVGGQMQSFQRVMIQVAFGLIATMVAGFAGIVATQL